MLDAAKLRALPSGAGAAPLKRTVTIVGSPGPSVHSGPWRHRQAMMRLATVENQEVKAKEPIAKTIAEHAEALGAAVASVYNAVSPGSGTSAPTDNVMPDVSGLTLEQRVYAAQTASAEYVRMYGMPCNLALGANYMPNIALLSAIGQLERLGLIPHIQNFAGCEGGAIIAALLAVGIPVAKIAERAISADFAKMMKSGTFAGRKFTKKHGLVNGKRFVAAFKGILSAEDVAPEITLKELHEQRGGRVAFAAVRVSDTRLQYIDYRTNPDLPLWEAVRAAVSIPTVMQPHKIGNELYISAGTVVGLPMDAFHYNDAANPINQRTIGLLAVCDGISAKPKGGLGATLAAALDCALSTAQRMSIDEQDRARTVVIDCGKMSSLDFTLSEQQRRELMDIGATAVIDHFAAGVTPIANKYGVEHNGFDPADEPQVGEQAAVSSVLRRGQTVTHL